MDKVFSIHFRNGHTAKVSASALSTSDSFASLADEANNLVAVVPLDVIQFVCESGLEKEFTAKEAERLI